MLRHFVGLLAGLVVAPLLWAGTAWSAGEIGERVAGGDLDDPALLTGTAAVMTIGLVCGLLAGSRVSPLAALVPGAALLSLSLWPLLDYASLQNATPDWLGSGSMFHPVGPALPVNIALGALLFISALAPSRWRSRPNEPEYGPAPQWNPGGAPPPVPPPTVTPDTADVDEVDPTRTTVPMRRGRR